MQQNPVPIETKHTYCILSLRWQCLTMLYVTEFSHGEKSLICHVLAEAKHMTVAVRLWHIPLLFKHKPATKQMPNQIRRSIWYHPFWHAYLPGATFQSNWGHTGPCFLSSTLTAGTHTHSVLSNGPIFLQVARLKCEVEHELVHMPHNKRKSSTTRHLQDSEPEAGKVWFPQIRTQVCCHRMKHHHLT